MATFDHPGRSGLKLLLTNRKKIVGWLQERLEAMKRHEFAQRVLGFALAVLARLELVGRRQSCVKRLASAMVVGIAGLVLMGHAGPKTQTVQADQFFLIDAAGPPRGLQLAGEDREPFQPYFLRYQGARVAVPTHYIPMTFTEFFGLPALPEEYEQAEWTTVREYTQRAVSLEGFIAELRRSTSDEMGLLKWGGNGIHVHLREAPQPRCSPDGDRSKQVVAAVTQAFQPPKTGWSYDALLDLCGRQARVRVSGWLLHDFEHVRDFGALRGSAWEIHPVTKIEVWDRERHSWSPLP